MRATRSGSCATSRTATRIVGRRPFACTRLSASVGDGEQRRRATYWLSADVKLLGYVARSIVQDGGDAEEEVLLGYGGAGKIDWGEWPGPR